MAKHRTEPQTHQCKAHLTESEWQLLQELKQRFGYRSDYEFTRSCLLLCITLLAGEGLQAIAHLPPDIRERLADIVNSQLGEFRHALLRPLPLFTDEAREHRPPKAWTEQFTERYYQKLFDEFDARTQMVREQDGYTPLDIFQDTILRAYLRPTSCHSYEEWEAELLAKFKCDLAIAEARHANKTINPIDYDCSEEEDPDEAPRLPYGYH